MCIRDSVCDDWSHGVLMREIAAGYTGGELPPLEIQYADYACWQREQQQGEDTEHLATYWKPVSYTHLDVYKRQIFASAP